MSMEPDRATILIVDDQPENLSLLSELLQPHYVVLAANNGQKAIQIAVNKLPDLILLDVMMPEIDGYHVFTTLRSNEQTREIPVIFVTALNETMDEVRGLELGAVDYITKPIEPTVMMARVHNQIELKEARRRLSDQNAFLESEVARRTQENDFSQEVGIRALAHLAEIRDPETGNHILRTQGYVQRLAELLRRNTHFADILNDKYIHLLASSAPLHDIGKVGVPDGILLKHGPLNEMEWAIMKTHAKLGSDAIELAERDAERPIPFLALAKEIAHWHHERWDGSGYPDGLKGEEIPLSARLMAIADVFDALISNRVYKEALSFDEARRIISDGKGKHFDPDIVECFLDHYDEFVAIAQKHFDPPEENDLAGAAIEI